MRIGPWEIVVVLLVALIVFGPSRLPEMGKAMGKAIREFRRATADLGKELEQARQELEGPVEERPRERQPTEQADQQAAPKQPG